MRNRQLNLEKFNNEKYEEGIKWCQKPKSKKTKTIRLKKTEGSYAKVLYKAWNR